ncbi:PPE family protein [Mycobacterium sp. MFM001]|uniref:PPE family protein, SVP subgroup n=1 Tax=Mycobacterium sp. MFM001 TaxID=2049453 RepID=UPI000DA4AB94|nr:PPE domain-containing protein [Mycobacterium sp. MFM001]GBE67063.1 PPE family protein [Mycobacterium sp. MFM001]
MEFAMLPPEVNSARIYAGPGSGPMLAAAAAWDALAAELGSAAASYEAVISQLAGGWFGPASTAMAGAAAPYAAWMHTAATQAEQTATQAKAAAAAYETAFAMTVPPPAVAANRAQLAALVATNFLGQNTPAIAATEAHYAEMWAQDAAAMYGYAGSAAAASQLTPFTPPDQATNRGGTAGQAAAVAQASATATGTRVPAAVSSISAAPQALQSLASPAASTPGDALAPLAAPALDASPALTLAAAGLGADLFGALVIDSAGSFGIDSAGSFGVDSAGVAVALQAAQIDTGGVFPGFTPFPGWGWPPVSAGMGQAGSVGALSVPQSWAAAAPAFRQVAAALPMTTAAAAPEIASAGSGQLFSEMALASMAGRALGGTAGLGRRERSAPTRASANPSPNGPVTGIAAELRELAELRDSGILTEEEFTEQKRRLLGH